MTSLKWKQFVENNNYIKRGESVSSAEHLIENLILGMSKGEDPDDILNEPCNVLNLGDTSMSPDDAVRIACHVVYSLYDGKFPRC